MHWLIVCISDTLADTASTSLGLPAGQTLIILGVLIVTVPVIFWLAVWVRWKMNKLSGGE